MQVASNKKETAIPVVSLRVGDRAKILGSIPKSSLDDIKCCYTSCSRC